MINGLYENILIQSVKNKLDAVYNKTRVVDKSESARVLATAYYKILRDILADKDEGERSEFVRQLNGYIGSEIFCEEDKKFIELLAVHNDETYLEQLVSNRPKTSIATSTLFTGYTGPTLESELKREIRTADRIDFIVSFIKYSGLVLIYEDLVEFTKNHKLRVITTSYMGASAINSELFNWESQSRTSVETPTGQRYINDRSNDHNVLFFVRESNKKYGKSTPFIFLGNAKYVSHKGSNPIQIVWRMDHPIPEKIIRESKLKVVN